MLTLVTPPAVEPVSLAEAKAHLRLEIDDDDDLVSALISAARQKCESRLTRAFVTSGWRFTTDGFPGQFSRYSPATGAAGPAGFAYGLAPLYGYIPERLLAGTAAPVVIPHARLISVSSISYLDITGTRQTLDPSKYSVEPGDGGRITPSYGSTWPQCQVYPASVWIDISLGYGPTSADVPACIRAAMKLLVGTLYECRESVVIGTSATELPITVNALLAAEDWGARP